MLENYLKLVFCYFDLLLICAFTNVIHFAVFVIFDCYFPIVCHFSLAAIIPLSDYWTILHILMSSLNSVLIPGHNYNVSWF